jgi:hypothetical protein
LNHMLEFHVFHSRNHDCGNLSHSQVFIC